MTNQIERKEDSSYYRLGKRIGSCSSTRPDITHEILMGIRDSMAENGFSGYGLGEILTALENQWNFSRGNPPVPFRPISGIGISGDGKL